MNAEYPATKSSENQNFSQLHIILTHMCYTWLISLPVRSMIVGRSTKSEVHL